MRFSPSFSSSVMGALTLGCLLLQAPNSHAQLRPNFYFWTCRNVFDIIGNVIVDELQTDPRIAASLLRLHFHDCFVHGCDASILLDNSTSFRTEKDAAPNANSARGFDVVDRMKTLLEDECPGTVSCADILTIASQISVLLSGGPWWPVPLGRRDSREAFFDLANTALPSPFFTLEQLKQSFRDVGLDRASDLVALSGGHTFGKAQCQFVTPRLYNFNGTRPDPTLNPTYVTELRRLCPQNGNGTVLVDFDPVTPTRFDSQYYTNLRNKKGLIQSDQELFSTPGADTIRLVEDYSRDQSLFFRAFVDAMIRMGNLRPLTGNQGEIRQNCRVVNPRIRVVENEDGVVSSM